jgi:hypothetical protein
MCELTLEQMKWLKNLTDSFPTLETVVVVVVESLEDLGDEFNISLAKCKTKIEKQRELKNGLSKVLLELGGKPGQKSYENLLIDIRKLQSEIPSEEDDVVSDDVVSDVVSDDVVEDEESNEFDVTIVKGAYAGTYLVVSEETDGTTGKAYRATKIDDCVEATLDPVTGEREYVGHFNGTTIIPDKSTKTPPAKTATTKTPPAKTATTKTPPAKAAAAKPVVAAKPPAKPTSAVKAPVKPKSAIKK